MSNSKNQTPKRVYTEALVLFVLNIVIFCGIFLLYFYLKKNQLHMQAVDIPLLKGGFDYTGLDLIVLIKKWTPYIGLAIGAAFSLVLLILMLIFTKLRRRSNVTGFILYLVNLVLFGSLAFDLLYLEPRSTALFSGIKYFVGVPFGFALLALFLFCSIWFFAKRFIGVGKAVVALFFILNLSGCSFTSAGDILCELVPDADHCTQLTAVQSGDSSDCEKIEGKAFQGENPPKDKCYLMSAVSTGNYGLCDKIEGGFTSYSKEQCLKEVAISKKDVAQCNKLTDPAMKADCTAQIPQEGDNPLKADEKPVARASNIDGDVRIIKEDGRVIPLTQDSVLGPNDKIATLDDSSLTIDLFGKGVHCVPPNTVLFMSDKLNTLEAACAVGMSIR